MVRIIWENTGERSITTFFEPFLFDLFVHGRGCFELAQNVSPNAHRGFMENIRKAIESHGGEVDLKPMTQYGTRLIGKKFNQSWNRLKDAPRSRNRNWLLIPLDVTESAIDVSIFLLSAEFMNLFISDTLRFSSCHWLIDFPSRQSRFSEKNLMCAGKCLHYPATSQTSNASQLSWVPFKFYWVTLPPFPNNHSAGVYNLCSQ